MIRLAFLISLLVLVAVPLELHFVRRWYGRRPISHSVVAASFLTGVVWTTFAVLLGWIEWHWKSASEPASSGIEWIGVAVLITLDAFLAGVVAMIPAGVVALIYRRCRGRFREDRVA